VSQNADHPVEPPEFARELAALRRQVESTRQTLDDLERALAMSLSASVPAFGKQLAYRRLIRSIEEVVNATIPRGSTVIALSASDETPMALRGYPMRHFPHEGHAADWGKNPGDNATGEFEAHRTAGASFLVVPSTSLSWLDQCPLFRGYLNRTYRLVHRSVEVCLIFDLRHPSAWHSLSQMISEFEHRQGRPPAILDWHTGAELAGVFPECSVFSPPGPKRAELPYLDRSIDVVVVSANDPRRLAEARRVATAMVVTTTSPDNDQGDWLAAVEQVEQR